MSGYCGVLKVLVFWSVLVSVRTTCVAGELAVLGGYTASGALDSHSLTGLVCDGEGLLVVAWNHGGTVTSATIAGESAEFIVSSSVGSTRVSVYSRVVGPGTHSAVLNLAQANANAKAKAYFISGYQQASAFDTFSATGTSVDRTYVLDFPDDGGFGIYASASGQTTLNWTNATLDAAVLSSTVHFNAAHSLGYGAGHQVTQVLVGSSGLAGVAACWSVADAPWSGGRKISFLLQVVAMGVCWVAGVKSVRFFLYVKNHRDFW